MRGGVGLGWRSELAADLLRDPGAVDFVEVVAETCFVQARTRREALALREVWPVLPHGVKLSLGSADGIDEGRARQLGALARELGAPLVSEHVAFTRGGGREIGHLTQLPRTRAAVAAVARNVDKARRHLPDVPLLLENVAFNFTWPDDEMDEATFYNEVVAATGCNLLLDLSNLYANATNEGRDPSAVLRAFPLANVGMIHLAGGVFEDGFYFDTHAAAVPDPVFDLLAEFFALGPDAPVLIERDAAFGPFEELRGEVDRAAALRRDGPAPAEVSRPTAVPEDAGEPLVDDQAALAAALTAVEPPTGALVDRFGAVPLHRAREVLKRKRVDDAMPLVPNIAACGDARNVAFTALRDTARAQRMAGIADAVRIAEAATQHPGLREAAVVDRLILRARFVGPDPEGAVRPRRGPFVGRAQLEDKRLFAIKAPGSHADVHLIERNR